MKETIRCRNPKTPQPSKSADFIRQMFGVFIPKWHPLSDDLNQYANRKLFQNSGINSSFRYSRKQQNGQIGCEWNVTGRSHLAFIQSPFLAVYKYTVCSNGVQCTSLSFVRRAGNQLSCQPSGVILRTGLTNLSAMWGHSPLSLSLSLFFDFSSVNARDWQLRKKKYLSLVRKTWQIAGRSDTKILVTLFASLKIVTINYTGK
jgi:hypothetical protein